jgi:hypothetical protein
MFSLKEKQYIASQVEKILLELNHPEMPKDKPRFHLRVDGAEDWSFAEIDPNWTFGVDNPPNVNPFNEVAREILK